jgi:hypothetical protein
VTKAWLDRKLAETNGKQEVWREATTHRFTWQGFNARLVQPDGQRTELGQMADDIATARRELRADLVIDLLSIRVRAKDRKRKGRLVETWLRGSMLRRLIELPRPSRFGFSHERYPIACGFLVAQGIAKRHTDGGLVWHDDFKHLRSRAEWLLNLVRREGELRRVDGRYEYE